MEDMVRLIVFIAATYLWLYRIPKWIAAEARQADMNATLWVVLHVLMPVGGFLVFLIAHHYQDPLKKDIGRLTKS